MLAMLMFAGVVYGQQVTVTGNVTSLEDGLPIPGVTVLEKGTTNGTTTGPDGNYTIRVASDATLVFSFLGMEPQELDLAGRTRIDVVMTMSVVEMDEVVVTSLGISREKKSLGYAMTEVGSDDIALVKDHNPANSLVGKVAGVVVTQGTGGPGSASRIIIRGNNSITGNNQPLIVVDGIPILDQGVNSGGSTYRSTVTPGGMTYVNPDDIESISVLKGPNAAALYGSRAGNGVLLITTKKGTRGRGLGVTVNSNITFDTPMILPDYQNEYGQGSQGSVPSNLVDLKNSASSWGAQLDGSQRLYYTGEQRPYVAQPDNVKDFFRTAGKYINTVSLDGGGENYSARFSYTNNMTESMLPGGDLKSHNFNLRTTADLTDRLSVDGKVTYLAQDINNYPSQGTEGVLAYVLDMPRNVDIEDMKTYQNPDESINSVGYSTLNANPYWIQLYDKKWDYVDKLTGFVKVNYRFTDWLSAFGRIGTDVQNRKRGYINQAGHHYFTSGRMNVGRSRYSETNADFLLTANKDDIIQDLSVTVIAGANHSYRTGEGISIYGEDYKIPTRATIANCVIQQPSYSPMSEHIINSVYGQISLDYNNFVYLDVTARNDWSSTLPEANRSYFYPSVTGSVLLNEIIDPAGEMFNLLKIRGSWANVGNDTSPYQIFSYFNVASDGYLGLTQLSRPSVKFNEDLKPENIASIEFGVEGRMFLDRIFFDIGFYQIKTTDQIYDVPVPAATGYSTFRENIGEMLNQGIEVLIGGSPVRTANFSWDVSLNFSRNVNELVELTEDLESHVFNTTNSGNVSIMATVGGGYGDIYGTDFRRTEEGELIVNAEGRPQATSDKVLLGNSQPDFIGGFRNSIRFKDISLSFLIDARIGGEIYSQTGAALMGSGVTKETLEYREEGIIVDGVVESGETFVPNTTSISAQDYWGSISGIAAAHVYEQTNVRLREFVLSYNVPSSLLTNLPIQNASIGLVGRNLLFLYKDVPDVDPEASLGTGNSGQGIISYNMPTARSIGFNINVKF